MSDYDYRLVLDVGPSSGGSALSGFRLYDCEGCIRRSERRIKVNRDNEDYVWSLNEFFLGCEALVHFVEEMRHGVGGFRDKRIVCEAECLGVLAKSIFDENSEERIEGLGCGFYIESGFERAFLALYSFKKFECNVIDFV